jgi:hypothetical protein
MSRGKQLAAEAAWRKQQSKLSKRDTDNTRSEFQSERYAGGEMFARALEAGCRWVCRQSIRHEPPRPRDGRGKPVFGSGRGKEMPR